MDVEAIVGVVALLIALICVGSGIYIWNIYRQRYEDGRLLRRIIVRDIRVSIAAGAIAFLIAYAYLAQPLPRPWGALIIVGAVITMMLGPISDAWLIFRERRLPRTTEATPTIVDKARKDGVL